MNKYEIRRLNLIKLKDQFCDGSIKNLADRLDKSHSYVSRLLYEEGKPNKKNIADRATTDIENSFNLPRGWLDGFVGDKNITDTIPLSEIKNNTVDEWDDSTPLGPDEVAVPFYKSIELAAGHGTTNLEDYNGFKLRFGKTFLSRKGAQKENVICFPVYGDSMEPRIPNKATVAVDTAKKDIIDGDIYAICQDGLCRVKRLYRMPHNKVRINSYNTIDNPDEVDDLANLQIIGRVFHYSADL